MTAHEFAEMTKFLWPFLTYFFASVALVPAVAIYKGRSALGWACTALLFTPLLALIALAAVPNLEREPKYTSSFDQALREER
ncbi:MAG: hypothetical protein ACRDGM_18580 [bacterium]